jgi:flagellin-like hook-associated protein FlgL
MGSHVLEASTLNAATEERAHQYERLREQFQTLKTELAKIADDSDFQGKPDAGGSFVAPATASIKIQTKIDLALLPEWKNTRSYEAIIEIPEGIILNIGRAEKQYTKSGAMLKGDED